jgi:hypothetical protein
MVVASDFDSSVSSTPVSSVAEAELVEDFTIAACKYEGAVLASRSDPLTR